MRITEQEQANLEEQVAGYLWEELEIGEEEAKRLSEGVVRSLVYPAFNVSLHTIATRYDPNFGDERECLCGHTYYRHFDSQDNMAATGCKYCGHDECPGFSWIGADDVG